MAAPNVSNIMKSGAVLYVAPVGEALPDPDTVGAGAAWGGDWERIGFTRAPLTLAYETDSLEIEVEEVLAPVDEARTRESATLETELAEVTAEYLTMLAGGSSVTTTAAGAGQVGLEEAEVGGEALLEKYAVGFEGEWINAAGVVLPVRFFFYRATLRLNGELEFSKKSGEYVGLPFQAKALASTETATFGRLFFFQRTTAPATS